MLQISIEHIKNTFEVHKLEKAKPINRDLLQAFVDSKTLLFFYVENGQVKQINEIFIP